MRTGWGGAGGGGRGKGGGGEWKGHIQHIINTQEIIKEKLT